MQKTLVLLSLLLSLACSLQGQSPAQQTCPVKIVKIGELSGIRGGLVAYSTGLASGRAFEIDYINRSDKIVSTVRFGVGYLNSMHELFDTEMVTTKESRHVKNKKYSVVGNNGHIVGNDKMRAVAWVEKIMFDDGTYWNDNGSRSCGNFKLPEARPSDTPTTASSGPNKLPAAAALNMISTGQASMAILVSTPLGAEVFVDDAKVGVTPLTLVLLRKGDAERVIIFRMKGYKDHIEKVVPTGAPVSISATLQPADAK